MLAAMLLGGCVEIEEQHMQARPVVAQAFQSLDAPPAAVSYTLDPRASWVYVVVYNDPAGLASGYGHDHGIRAMEFTGSVRWDAGVLASCAIDLSFPATALQPDPPGMRERAKLDPDGAVVPRKLETIRENFLGKSQLDAARYPTISYRSTSCTGSAEHPQVQGTLTIRGVSKPITTTMDVNVTPTTFAASGSFTARATDFGFKPFSNFGVLKNHDEMTFVIDVVGFPMR